MTPEARAGGGGGDRWLPTWVARSYLVQELRWRLLARSRADRESRNPFPWMETREFGNAWREDTWPEQESQIRAMRDATVRIGARLAIIAIPHEAQLDDRALSWDVPYTLKPQRKLAEITRRFDLPFLDLHPQFLRARDQDLYRPDGLHLSPSGHQLAADEMMTFIQRENLLGLPGDAPVRAETPSSIAERD